MFSGAIEVEQWLKMGQDYANLILYQVGSEAARQRCSLEKVFRKYAENLLENTNAEVWFQ